MRPRVLGFALVFAFVAPVGTRPAATASPAPQAPQQAPDVPGVARCAGRR
jgi:hypothetical protein